MNKIIERIKNNFAKNKIILGVLIILWIIIAVVTINGYKETLGKESFGNMEYNYVEVLNPNRKLTQIVDAIDGVDAISVRMEVYIKNNSNVNIEVVGLSSNKTYGEKTMRISKVLGASFNTVGLDKSLDTKIDKKIKIIISTNDDNGAIGVWCSFDNVLEGTLYATGENLNGSMSARFLYKSEMYKILNDTILAVLIVFITISILYALLLEPKLEILYTLTALVIGLIFVVVLTPISGPDEEYHYRAALQVSNKLLGKENPDIIEDLYISYRNSVPNFNVGQAYRTVIEQFDNEMPSLEGRRMYDLERGYVYWYDACYMPQAIGITVCRLLGLNFFKVYYSGRICSLLFYTFCVYVALKKTPVFKSLFGIMATLPICIQQSVAYGQDMWIYGLSLVVFGYFLKWYFSKEKIDWKEYICVLIFDALLCPCKTVYSLFMVPYLFLPDERFHSKKHKWIALGILMVPVLRVVGYQIIERVWIAITHPIHAEDTGTSTFHEVEVFFSLQYIAAHPIETVQIIFRTIRAEAKSWFAGAIGRYLSGLTLILPSSMSYLITGILLISAFVFEKNQMSGLIRLVLLGVCFMIFAFTMLVMLTGWTDIKDEYVLGIQGRYFTPTLTYIFSTFNNKKVYLPKNADLYIFYAQLIILFETVVYMLSYTFVY